MEVLLHRGLVTERILADRADLGVAILAAIGSTSTRPAAGVIKVLADRGVSLTELENAVRMSGAK
jgi:hypothetical protein